MKNSPVDFLSCIFLQFLGHLHLDLRCVIMSCLIPLCQHGAVLAPNWTEQNILYRWNASIAKFAMSYTVTKSFTFTWERAELVRRNESSPRNQIIHSVGSLLATPAHYGKQSLRLQTTNHIAETQRNWVNLSYEDPAASPVPVCARRSFTDTGFGARAQSPCVTHAPWTCFTLPVKLGLVAGARLLWKNGDLYCFGKGKCARLQSAMHRGGGGSQRTCVS